MDYQKGFIVLVQVLIYLVGLTVAQPPLFYFCINNGNYTENSAYQANLNALISTLSSNVDKYGFYDASLGQNSNRVNAAVLCRGDVQLDTCRACINNATRDLIKLCPNYKEAIIWYDYCMLRYTTKSIAGTLTTYPGFYMWNPENSTNANKFNQELRTLVDSLRRKAAYGGPLRKFAAGKRTGPDFRTIYALEQCTPDLSARDCSRCLIGAAEQIPTCCNGKIGGRVVEPSCSLRFETYSFFNETS